MATKLDKTIKREIELDGQAYMVAISPDGVKMTQKGFRKGREISWRGLWEGSTAEGGGSSGGGRNASASGASSAGGASAGGASGAGGTTGGADSGSQAGSTSGGGSDDNAIRPESDAPNPELSL